MGHEFTSESPVSFHFSDASIASSGTSETFTLGEITGLSDDEISELTEDDLYQEVQPFFDDWLANQMDAGFSIG